MLTLTDIFRHDRLSTCLFSAVERNVSRLISVFTLSFRNRFHLWHPIIILFIFYLRRPARLTRVNEMTPDIRSAGTISKRNSLIEQPDQTRLDSLCGIIGQLLILVDSVFPLLSHLLALEMRSRGELE